MAAPIFPSRVPVMPQTHDNGGSRSPRTQATTKTVAFELMFPESPQTRARLPLRVQIYPHDRTDSIVTTVKNFYGLYSGPRVSKGVSFEDANGNTLIAHYDNFNDNMVVYVRVFEEESVPSPATIQPNTYQPGVNGDGYPSQAPQAFAQHVPRPMSRAPWRRGPSPNNQHRRSTSAGKGRSQASSSRGSGSQSGHDGQGASGYTSGDGAPGSSSGHLGNTEISLENIVEGGRRKRAKFESSELPLFAPAQMPSATSNPSISPIRRAENQRPSLPYAHHYGYPPQRPMQSPQSYSNGFGHPSLYATPTSEQQRSRNSVGYPPAVTPGAGVLPTPDPTVGSCVSEEDKDVALQLMRLGEMSNVSQGRTSASTLDDTFSGRADAASSTGATSDSESEEDDELPAARRQRLDMSGNHQKILPTTETHFAPRESIETDEPVRPVAATHGLMSAPKLKNPKSKTESVNGFKPIAKSAKTSKPTASKPKMKKATSENGFTITNVPIPMSPASMPASRKQSVISSAAMPSASGDDEPDLSTKPRCQRCRKSKKGCDRQRPCGRCKDAGLPADQCVSEDEGNGRKGRYGRHMGVPLKTGAEMLAPSTLLPAAPITAAGIANGTGAASAAALADSIADKNKKRKR